MTTATAESAPEVELPPLEEPDDLESIVEDRVVVAMSGGVDSSVTAALCAEQGLDAVGISMRLYATPQDDYSGSCCSPDDLFDARRVANSVSMPFYVANYQEEFRERVIDYFVDEYRRGRTPNPCVACNNHLKFDILLDRALALGSRYLATGHYARIDRSGDRPRLMRGADPDKDQSYFLFGMPREALSRVLFPLGDLQKGEVREHAERLDLATADKPESHEICFVGGGDYQDYVEERLAEDEQRPGDIVHQNGEKLGEHEGIHQFTIGQRRGLGISYHERLYVQAVRPEDGTVVVGPRDGLMARGLVAEQCNWLAFERPEGPIECEVQIRYNADPVPALVTVGDGPETAFVEFVEPQRAVTPGQAAVFYHGDEVLGGGFIEEARA
ncbi:MAG: tRNA 2-thiouridine(34) synthase MnmA [Bradymonadaceae bacterium]